MPKKRSRKTQKAAWTSETLAKALRLMANGTSMRKAANETGIPFSTLQIRNQKNLFKNPSLGRKTVFSGEVEKEIADLVKKMAKIFYGCTAIQVRKLAYEYAESLKLPHNFNNNSKMAGRDWLEGFLKRNGISIRKPEATSINRVTAFNKTEVSLFYKNLEKLMETYKFTPKNIYNCDETGISTVQDPGKILAPKGQKRVGSLTSWERGKNITVMCTMSAAGSFIPPMFIFPRKRHSPLLEKDGPAGAIYRCSDNGWINEILFFEWIQHFTTFSKPSAEEPILLILDNHASHISHDIYNHCKAHNIHMLSLPPHTSHRMQPLDVTFYGPLKAAYKKESDCFMKSHLAERITPYDVASLFNKAYSNVASISKGESGFRVTGIFPMNSDVFTEEDFLPAEILQGESVVIQDNENCSLLETTATLTSQEPLAVASTPVQEPLVVNEHELLVSTPEQEPQVVGSTSDEEPRVVASTSVQEPQVVASTSVQEQLVVASTSGQEIPPKKRPRVENFINFPTKTLSVSTRQGRKKQHSTILTSTPIKDSLIEKENKKQNKILKEKGKQKGKGKGKKTKENREDIKKAKRKVLQEDNSSLTDVDIEDICGDDDDEDSKNYCLICGEFGQNNEVWYRCTFCGLWAHSACTGWDSATGYVCDMC